IEMPKIYALNLGTQRARNSLDRDLLCSAHFLPPDRIRDSSLSIGAPPEIKCGTICASPPEKGKPSRHRLSAAGEDLFSLGHDRRSLKLECLLTAVVFRQREAQDLGTAAWPSKWPIFPA